MAIGCLRARQDRAQNILAASILAISVAELTDTLLFGGLSFPGFWLAMCVGLLAVRPAEQGERVLDRAGAVDLRSSGQTALTGV